MTMKFDDPTMIRIGQGILACGVVLMLLPVPRTVNALIGLVLIGLGCAPIYPCIIHSTPAYFGEDKSQAVVGVQMASAYIGSLAMPPLFGLIAQYVSISWYPWYLIALLAIMVFMHERLRAKTGI
jgi:MFS family permease